MQFITTDQRIAVENFEVGVVYTVAFTSGDSFTGSCMGIGADFVAFQRTAPEYIFCLTMTTAADVASIEPLSADIGKILTYTGSVPVSIKTDGTPLLDYLITGSTVQDGTPTPENPIMPQGTGERTGNLWSFYPEQTMGGVTLSWNGEKISYSGTCTSSNNFLMNIKLKAGTYTLKANANRNPIDNNYSCIDIYRNSPLFMAVITNREAVEGSKTFTIDEDMDAILRIRVHVGANYDGFEIRPMLNLGSTALPYEPYGYKTLISSAGQTTPVYLGEVQTMRKVKKLVLDGTETITEESANVYSIPINDTVTAEAGLSTHFEYDSTVLAGQFRIEAGKAVFGYNDTLANFSAFLAAQYAAGTPVTVWYVLATEETAVVNEPLMRIGDYADTLSYRQSGVSIPTSDGLSIFDIDTTVKPSEVYLKYFSPLF